MSGDIGRIASPRGTEPEAREVSIRQRYAIQLLLEGLKDSEVADMVPIPPAMLRAWKQNPRFRRAWAEAQDRPRPNLGLLGGVSDMKRHTRRRPQPETPWMSEGKEKKRG